MAEGLDIPAQAGGLRRAICTLAAGPLGTSTPYPSEYSSQLSGKSFAFLFLHQQIKELGLRKTEHLAESSAVDQENPDPNPGHYKPVRVKSKKRVKPARLQNTNGIPKSQLPTPSLC